MRELSTNMRIGNCVSISFLSLREGEGRRCLPCWVNTSCIMSGEGKWLLCHILVLSDGDNVFWAR